MSASIMPQIKYPEITKKTSTPTKPPAKPRNARVVKNHGNDGERAQAIDVGAIFHASCLVVRAAIVVPGTPIASGGRRAKSGHHGRCGCAETSRRRGRGATPREMRIEIQSNIPARGFPE